jgi:hypothetical protein
MITILWIVLNIAFVVMLLFIIASIKQQYKRAIMDFTAWLFAFALFNLAYYQYVVKGAV